MDALIGIGVFIVVIGLIGFLIYFSDKCNAEEDEAYNKVLREFRNFLKDVQKAKTIEECEQVRSAVKEYIIAQKLNAHSSSVHLWRGEIECYINGKIEGLKSK